MGLANSLRRVAGWCWLASVWPSLAAAQSADVADDPRPSPWAETPDAALMRLLGRSPPVATARTDADLAAGTVSVQVVDEAERPVADAGIDVGMLAQGEPGRRLQARTDAQGRAVFRQLAVGIAQAYRVNLHHQGAKFSTDPFQLPPDQGYAVRIVRLPTTREDGVILQSFGQTALEFRDDRLHVVQTAQLVNLSGRVFVFGQQGTRIGLPEGFLALQTDKIMSDQRLTPTRQGLDLFGSLPPGVTTLRWAFDLPRSGSALNFSQPVPWRTHMYQVVASAAPGMQLSVDGLPPAIWRRGQRGRVLATQIERQPNSAPFDRLQITIDNIPGPGPWRWWAVVGSLLLLLALWRWRPTVRTIPNSEIDSREQALLAEIAALQHQLQQQQVGENYYQRRRQELTDALAALIRAKSAA